MMKKLIVLMIVFSLFLVSLVCAADVSYCCEKTNEGAWCQNSPQAECSSEYRSVPASCEATSYCKLGTCVDSQEGTCMENTPEIVCEDNGGVWAEGDADEISRCSLGCCSVGNGAAFVTQTRCKRLSSLYGLETVFSTEYSSEMSCIASSTSSAKGACVLKEEYETTCVLTTQEKCSALTTNLTEFHEGFLCSAESLATNCGPTETTTCVEGSDEVYFKDSCGNLANIYDANKLEDKNYWSTIYDKDESCGSGGSNANSATCGNCDYYLGSMCKGYERKEDRVEPNYGENVCRDLSCEYEGRTYSHGETWCANSAGISKNLPGSRYFRLVCYNGEVSVEPCADYRQEICIESSIQGFSTSGCIANMWQDCLTQISQKDCLNTDRRDCKWVASTSTVVNASLGLGCVPLYAPGFKFWETGNISTSSSTCSMVSQTCVVKYEEKLLKDKKCTENCDCLTDAWAQEQEKMCVAIGDCGNSSTNYLGVLGY